MGEKGREKRRRQRFIDCLGMENVDLAELRKLSWAGIPGDLRPIVWQLLLVSNISLLIISFGILRLILISSTLYRDIYQHLPHVDYRL